jgi:hypothetical protein
MKKLNLYLVTRNDSVDYDQYASMVVATKNEEAARMIKPYNGTGIYDLMQWSDDLTVLLVGKADKSIKVPYVVIKSFNAG